MAEDWINNVIMFDSLNSYMVNKRSMIKAKVKQQKYNIFIILYFLKYIFAISGIFIVFKVLNNQNKEYLEENMRSIFRNLSNVINYEVIIDKI